MEEVTCVVLTSVASGCLQSTPASFDTVAFVSAYDASTMTGPGPFSYDVEVWFQ